MSSLGILDYAWSEGENIVISLLLQNRDVDEIVGSCTPHFFVNEGRRQIYKLATDYAQGAGNGEVHYRAVLDGVQAAGKLTDSIQKYLEGRKAADPRSFPELVYVINRLKDMSMRRALFNTLRTGLDHIQNMEKPADHLITDLEEQISLIDNRERGKLEVITKNDIVVRRGKGLIERWKSKGIYTGYEMLDKRLTVGFSPGKISVIAGRTSMGKSFFKTNLIRQMCLSGTGVMNVSPEQGFDSEHDRLDAINTSIHLNSIIKLRSWDRDHENWKKLKQSSIDISQWPYTSVPNPRLSVSQIRTAIRRTRSLGTPVDVVFIDLFDRLDDVNVARDRAGTISVKLGEIERIAKEEDVHICNLVQINRAVEGKTNKRPTMGNLRDSGNFEQDSDLVFLLYREGYYNEDIDDNILEVKLEKQRDGISGIWFQFLIVDKQTLELMPMGEKEKTSDID